MSPVMLPNSHSQADVELLFSIFDLVSLILHQIWDADLLRCEGGET